MLTLRAYIAAGFLGAVVAAGTLTAQTLQLPARPTGAPGGDAFAASVSALTREQREEQVFQEVTSGNVPDFFRRCVSVTTTSFLDGKLRTAQWYVTPEYIAIGGDDDYFLMPMTPVCAQRIADALGCSLPTRKMVDAVYAASTVKVAPIPIPPSGAMTTVPVFKQHNDTLRLQRAALLAGHPLGELVAGHKKDVIISNAITTNLKPAVPKPVVIYGWHQPGGVPIQPLYNGHAETYADYSHGIRLVQRSVLLDSIVTTVEDLVRDSVLWPLLSDEGAIAHPRFGYPSNSVPHEDAAPAAPEGFELRQNYPNPFNPTTRIGFSVRGPVPGWVHLTVYDMLGKPVTTLIDEVLAPGEYAPLFDGSNVASGPYYYSLQARGFASTRSCLLVR